MRSRTRAALAATAMLSIGGTATAAPLNPPTIQPSGGPPQSTHPLNPGVDLATPPNFDNLASKIEFRARR